MVGNCVVLVEDARVMEWETLECSCCLRTLLCFRQNVFLEYLTLSTMLRVLTSGRFLCGVNDAKSHRLVVLGSGF